MIFRVLLSIGLVCAAMFPAANAQIVVSYPGIPRFDAGVQFTAIQLKGPITTGDLGIGLHFGYNFNSYLSFESDVNAFHLTSGGQQDAHTTEALFGARIGYTSREAGIYLKVLPGFIHFPRANDQVTTPLNPSTHFALDTGVVLVRYFPNHVYVRFDGGATIINYGSGSFLDPVSGQRVNLGVRGAPSFALGVGFHF
jgi:Outer membrane protein beta-barrel domain